MKRPLYLLVGIGRYTKVGTAPLRSHRVFAMLRPAPSCSAAGGRSEHCEDPMATKWGRDNFCVTPYANKKIYRALRPPTLSASSVWDILNVAHSFVAYSSVAYSFVALSL